MNTDREVSGGSNVKQSLNGNSAARAGEKAINTRKDQDTVAADTLEMAGERWNDFVARGQEISKVGVETFRKYPLYSVLGVASVAFLAGFLLKGRRR